MILIGRLLIDQRFFALCIGFAGTIFILGCLLACLLPLQRRALKIPPPFGARASVLVARIFWSQGAKYGGRFKRKMIFFSKKMGECLVFQK
ncbi:MAG: hypothetical protein ACI30R_09695 [Sodaliphilus sp.]